MKNGGCRGSMLYWDGRSTVFAEDNEPLDQDDEPKRAVLVGCNYPSTQLRLQGCINDVSSMENFIANEFGFHRDDVMYLIDEPGLSPWTWNNPFILELGESYKEEEAIVPCDLNLITNMDLRRLIQKPQPGTSFTILSDSCHSGGLIDKDKEQIGPSRMKGIPLPVYYKSRGISIGSIMDCLHSVTGAIQTGAIIAIGVANAVNAGVNVVESIGSGLSASFSKEVSISFRPEHEQRAVMKSRSLTEDEGLS
ncbi:hypothetical protein F3Y22_tig00006230pilonHSYRG00023 [Hibiscus syriacus]|uniref:Peptidase C14 caspase domain-containing protein n=1 Tax=Hibiscus syriacus TaxID=106335 RepID=A0A6A3CDB7_HIBSY|nr:hypothetical protein F3Y22_tig00006230pilonHSYRG00023 [Hibiscus syriacus]